MVLYFMVLVSIASAPKLGLNLLEMSSRIGRQRVLNRTNSNYFGFVLFHFLVIDWFADRLGRALCCNLWFD